MISPLGGSLNLLFKVKHATSEEAREMPDGAESGILGKLDIQWRTNLGDIGRLQTQSISASAAAIKDISLQVDCFISFAFTISAVIQSSSKSRMAEMGIL